MSLNISNKIDAVYASLSILGLALLSFIGGAAVVEFETFPYPQLLEAPFRALRNPYDSLWWQKVDHDERRVTTYDPAEMYGHYTVYQTVHSAAYLIDPDGNRVHTWKKPFHEAWPDPPHVDDPVDEDQIHWSGAHVFPNGDVVANYTAAGDTPYGYGLVKLDRNSEMIWKYPEHVHHDVTVTDGGPIWTILHEFRKFSGPSTPDLPGKFRGVTILDDILVKLSPRGEELRRIPLTRAVLDSPLGDHLADWHRGKKWDLLHTNSVEPISADFAEHHDFAEPGQLLVSFRRLDTIALVDRSTERISWFDRRFWVRQHDPDARPNGNIILFDNQGWARRGGGMSRIVEYNPGTGAIAWSYTGTRGEPFRTKWGGKQTPLPNGNVLIAENLRSRLFEVNRRGEIVWEFYNPLTKTRNGVTYMGTISGGHQRLPKDGVEFLD